MDAQRQLDYLTLYLKLKPRASLQTAMTDLNKRKIAESLMPQSAPDIGRAIDAMRKIAVDNKLKIMALMGTE